SSIDKHRYIHSSLAWWGEADASLSAKVKHEGEVDQGEFTLASGESIERNAEFLRLHLIDCPRVPPHVDVDVELPVDVAFGEPGFPIRSGSLFAIDDYVTGLCQLFEPFFKGS